MPVLVVRCTRRRARRKSALGSGANRTHRSPRDASASVSTSSAASLSDVVNVSIRVDMSTPCIHAVACGSAPSVSSRVLALCFSASFSSRVT